MKTKISSHWPLTLFSSLSALANLALPLVLVRILTPEEVGHYKIFFLYLALMPWLSMSAGINNGLYHWVAQSRFKVYFQASWTLLLGWSIVVTALIAGFVPVLFAVGSFLIVISSFHEEALVAAAETWRGAIFASFFDILRTALVLTAALHARSLEAVIQAYVLGLAIKSFFGVYWGRRLGYQKIDLHFSKQKQVYQEVLSYAVPVSAANLMAVVTHFADQLVLSRLASASYFASYTLGCLTVPPLNSFEQAINRVMIPSLAKEEGAAAVFKEAVAELAWILIPATAGLFVFAEPIVTLLFTAKYASVAIFLKLYAFSYLILIFPYDAYARAKGESAWILKNLSVALLFALVAIPLLSFRFLGLGALIGLLSTQLVLRIGGYLHIRRRTNWELKDFIPFSELLYFTTVVLVLSLLSYWIKNRWGGGIRWFLVAGPLFTVCYLVLTLRRRFQRHLASRKRPAVLHLTQYLEMGGLERVIYSLCVGTQNLGRMESFVFSYDLRANARSLRGDFEALGISVLPREPRAKARGFSFSTLIALIRACFREKIGLIHTHDLGPLVYASIAKFLTLGTLRIVHTQHSFVHLQKKKRYRYYEQFFTRWADELVVVSPDNQAKYVELGVAPGRIRLIPNGASFPLGAPESINEKATLRALLSHGNPALAASLERVWIIYLARIHAQKGQTSAIELWKALPTSTREKAVLIFVGQESFPGEIEKLKESAQKRIPESISQSRDEALSQVIFAGPSSDPMGWLKACDLFISLSEFEGMPLSPIEAYGAGVPLILSQIAGHSLFQSSLLTEITWIDLPVKIADGPVLAERIEELFLSAQSGQKGIDNRIKLFKDRIFWRKNYSVDEMAEKYGKLYRGPAS
jgi:O-antigen/teichoic acid export membrane protein/glycosyltransferase involved in cell wall biosynthesis